MNMLNDPTVIYVRALLGTHVTAMRRAWLNNDRGASAVELAFISAIILVIAAALLVAIRTFVTNASNNIKGTSVTKP